MTEATAAGAYAPPTGERPRISAAAFKNLTARLKKSDAAAPAHVASSAAAALPTVPDLIAQAHAQVVAPPVPVAVVPVAPHVPPVAPPTVIQTVTAPAAEVTPAVAPPPSVRKAAALPDFPPLEAPVTVPQPVPQVELAPAVEAERVSEPVMDPPAQEVSQAAEVPAIEVPVAEALPAEPVAVEEAAPKPVTHGPAIPAESAEDAVAQDAISRKEALELDVIWRSLLANPTLEERAQYLREAAEIMAEQGIDLPAPAAEHDLSNIAPAESVAPEDAPELLQYEAAADETSAIIRPAAEPDATANDNAELARSLLDMMASGAGSGLPHERALAADTLLRLLPKLELKPLVMMAQRLSKADNPPQMLVAKLIRDPRVEVAGPLLEDCPQITDKDLETVVTEGNAAKLRMLARRRNLTAAISDALIGTGDGSVMLTLVRNMEASISQDGFQNLIVAAEREKDLLAPLSTRPDLPAPLAFELFWLAPPQLRRYILSRFLTDSETLTKILKITLSTNEPEDLGDRDSSSQHAMVEALERAARGRLEIASEELGQLLQIAPATALRILNDVEGEPLVVMLKVSGFPRQALPGVLRRFRDSDLPILSSDRDLAELQSIYDTLSFNKARILLTYWDWAQRKTGPYAPLH